MKRKELTIIFGFIALLFLAAGAWAAPVPDTWLTKCYNNTGEMPCPSPGQAFFGQDANYMINRTSYTKLDGSGNALPVSATYWTAVRDNVTGLIWESKTNMDGVENPNDFHDADNKYFWYDSNPVTNGGYAGAPGSNMDTEDFINSLNKAKYGGYNDWRMPTIKELTSLMNYIDSSFGPKFVDTGYFPNNQNDFYWSSTTSTAAPSFAWVSTFQSAYDSTDFKDSNTSHYVRAVRGGPSGENFTNNGNGTVTDTASGLMWQQPAGSSVDMTWEQALAYCEGLNLGGYTDWRLPNIKELQTLVDFSNSNPAINTQYFSKILTGSGYWSSTTNPLDPVNADFVEFLNGSFLTQLKTNSSLMKAIAVRGGITTITPDLKANGQDGLLTVSSGTPVSITASLTPGNQGGKLADWWLAYSSPAGWNSFGLNGWAPGINSLIQYPLLSFPAVVLYSNILPVGDYAFYFILDMSPSVIDLPIYSPLFYDFVQVHVTN